VSQYIHHTPGRIRVRSRAFRCRGPAALDAERQLQAMDGVRGVRVNARAGSITVHYDPERLGRGELLTALEQVGCLGAARMADERSHQVVQLFGQALVGAVVKKAVEQSARTLVGVLV
jgi:copper chaperone CopZ